MKNVLAFWSLVILSTVNVDKSTAQNLVPNPGFELYDSLPCNFIQSNIEFGQYIQDWFLPTGGTSDIISNQIPSTCSYGNPLSFQSCGNQYPRTGDAMTGVIAASFSTWNEYLEVQFSTPLTAGKRYYFECYILFGVCANFASNNYGAALSVNVYSDTNTTDYIPLQPVVLDSTIKNNSQQWEKISGCFLSDSAYQFLLLGHFQNNCDGSSLAPGTWPTSYYFIDDVYLAEDSTCELTGTGCILADHVPEHDKSNLTSYIESGVLKLFKKDFKGTLSIFSAEGKAIMTDVNFESSSTIDLSAFAQGIYIGVLSDEKDKAACKFKFVRY